MYGQGWVREHIFHFGLLWSMVAESHTFASPYLYLLLNLDLFLFQYIKLKADSGPGAPGAKPLSPFEKKNGVCFVNVDRIKHNYEET